MGSLIERATASILAAVFLTSAVMLASCSAGLRQSNEGNAPASNRSSAKAHTVIIRHFKFEPPEMTIHPGDTIEWKNQDIVPHTATSIENSAFNSGNLAVGASWKHVADQKGVFLYECTLHPNMKAKLVVE